MADNRLSHRYINQRQSYPDYRSADYGSSYSDHEQFDDNAPKVNVYLGPNFEEDIPDDTNDQRGSSGAKNYGSLFAIDGEMLSKRLSNMSGNCRKKIKPKLGRCIEISANRYDVNVSSDRLGPNDCKALWDLMCCLSEFVSKECESEDLKTIQLGFTAIQGVIETKDCKNTNRGTVDCKAADNTPHKDP